MEKKLTSEKVNSVFQDCLFREGEDTTSHIKAEGVMKTVGFHPVRLESHKLEIVELLQELPEEFQETKGGGWSFLNACLDKNGNQWTGLHSVMEELFLLGIAAGKVKFQLPRHMWAVLPGGMPYLVISS